MAIRAFAAAALAASLPGGTGACWATAAPVASVSASSALAHPIRPLVTRLQALMASPRRAQTPAIVALAPRRRYKRAFVRGMRPPGGVPTVEGVCPLCESRAILGPISKLGQVP